MTIAEGVPPKKPSPIELIHQNAILGCMSWALWEKINFQQSERLTWFQSSIKDILFNSVLHADLSEAVFDKILGEVTDYCTKEKSPLAWLVHLPSQLSDFHRNRFAENGFREQPGTTGMYLELDNPKTQPLFLPKSNEDNSRFEVLTVDSDELLAHWAQILIESYRFPAELTQAWLELHSAIGYRSGSNQDDGSPWEHLVFKLDNQYVGTSSLFCGKGVHNASFANLAVSETARGEGIGSFLVRHSLERLLNYRYNTVTLYASQDAFGLYSRLGFTPCIRNTFFLRDGASGS